MLSALVCPCVAAMACAATGVTEIHGINDVGDTVVWGDSDSYPIIREANPQTLIAWSPVLVYGLARPAATRRYPRRVCTFRYATRERSCAAGGGSRLAGAVHGWADRSDLR
ncbi:MAG TPA: hypothetical protein VF265_02605 [Nevskiaceae bacterium]